MKGLTLKRPMGAMGIPSRLYGAHHHRKCPVGIKGPHRFILMHQFDFIVIISLHIRVLTSEYISNTPRNHHDKIELMHQNESMRTLNWD